jgi:hypothetical protein
MQKEQNEPNPIERPKAKRRKDTIDRRIPSYHHMRNMILVGMPTTIGGMVLEHQGVPYASEVSLAGSLYLFSTIIRALSESPVKHTVEYDDEQLKYQVYETLYKGETLTRHRAEITEGDSILHMRLPKLQWITNHKPEVSEHAQLLHSQAQRLSLQEIAGMLKTDELTYDAVYFQTSSLKLPALSQKQQIVEQTVYADKQVVLQNPEQEAYLLSKSEFESLIEHLTVSPAQLFVQGTESLQDTYLSDALAAMKHAESLDERTIAAEVYTNRLESILQQALEKKVNGSERKLSKDIHSHHYHKQKIGTMVKLVVAKDNISFLSMKSSGEVKKHPIADVFHTDETKLLPTIQEFSQERNGHIATILRTMLLTHDIFELINLHEYTTEEIQQGLQKENLQLFIEPYYKSIVNENETTKKHFTALHKSLLPLALVALLGATLHTGKDVVDDIPNFGNGRTNQTTEQTPFDKSQFRSFSVFTDGGDGEATIDWKVTPHGAIDESGYYTFGTSNFLTPFGNWSVSRDNGHTETLSDAIPSDTPFLQLEKRVTPESLNVGYALPIRSGTAVEGLSLTDQDGNRLPAKITQFEDGSLFVTQETPSDSQWIDIDVYLTESETPQVTAGSPLVTKVERYETNGLNEKALEQIRPGFNQPSVGGDAVEEVLFASVRDAHVYTISNSLESADTNYDTIYTLDEIVNHIATLTGCSCSECNTEAVLFTGIDPLGGDYVNMAFGYLHQIDNNAANPIPGFLLSSSAHGYGIDEKGALRDATPADTSFLSFFRNIAGQLQQGENGQLQQAWENSCNNLKRQMTTKISNDLSMH